MGGLRQKRWVRNIGAGGGKVKALRQNTARWSLGASRLYRYLAMA